MLEGMLTLWGILTLLSMGFMLYDLIFVTPEAGVMKLGWFLVVLYTGPIGLFFYLLSCREPIPETHERFIRPLWKQSLGSEVHCLAGDATGIVLAAIILSFYQLPRNYELLFEYLAGFFFGLFIFQSLFMKKMMGGTYIKAIKNSFYSEWTSMNMIMAGMIPVMVLWDAYDPLGRDPSTLHFWGKMSLATLVGGILGYPINQWLVSRGLKHGMMTIRGKKMTMEHIKPTQVTSAQKLAALFITIIVLFAFTYLSVRVKC